MRLDDDVLAALSALDYPAPDRAVLTEQLDRETYVRVDKALQALGGKWTRRAKAHVFPGDARSRVDAAITSGKVTTDQDLGHFPTPPPLARQLVRMAGVRRGHRALEPSAGTGNLVAELLAVGAIVTAIERDPARRQALRDRLFAANVLALDDFMIYRPRHGEPEFDRIVMNPPFRRCGEGDHLDHARLAFDLLAPGGRLVCVLPASVTFRRDRRHAEFRAWAESVGELAALPEGSFRASGTDVRTATLAACRRPA
jgi:phospholipid N-methyltransferase